MSIKKRPVPPIKMYPEEYEWRRNAVRRSIKCHYPEVLILWCPTGYDRPDVIGSIMGDIDPYVEIIDRWCPTSTGSQIWGGAVAKFSEKEKAKRALIEIRRTTSVLGIAFNKFLDCIIHVDVTHHLYSLRTMTLYIEGRRSFTEGGRKDLLQVLNSLGTVLSILFYERNSNGLICTVKFPHASHAISTKIFLNGMYFPIAGKITIKTSDIEQETEIMSRIKNIMQTLGINSPI